VTSYNKKGKSIMKNNLNKKINQTFIKYIEYFVILHFLFLLTSISIYADCRLCPEITPVKILLKNGVIRMGHIAINPEEEISVKPDRAMEVIRKAVKLRLYLSLDSLVDLNLQMPHVLQDKVYMDILYKDIAKIELLEKIDN
jgi:hypothetical protein